jgi:DNA-binding beta-propeller fold protein YncE
MTTFDPTSPAESPAALEASASSSQVDASQSAGAVPTESAPTKMSKKSRAKIATLVIVMIIFALIFAWYLMNRKPLTELPGLSVAKVPHYQFSIYGVSHPLGVAATATGDRIYVTQSDGERTVRIFNRAGKPVGTLNPPKSTGPSHMPIYVAINPTTQDVYVSDRSAAAIYIYDAAGKYLRTFAPKGNLGGKWNPLGLAFGPDGTLYATDVRSVPAKSQRILVFAPDGTLVRSMGAPGQLSFPNGVVVDSQGNLQVSDSNNGRLVIFDPTGKVKATISRGIGEGDLGLPRGAAVDDSGRLFVADTSDHMVRVYTIDKSKATPTYVGSFGTEGQTDGTFEYPNGVATDSRARVYVTDRENNRLQVWGY